MNISPGIWKNALAYSVTEAARLTSLSRSSLYIAMATGKLRYRKYGGRRLILHIDLMEFLQRLSRGCQ